MEQLVERAYETFSEQARRALDRLLGRRRTRRPVIVSDGDRVLQIVDNLLSNAFRATPDGGRIALELGADERHDPRGGRGHRAGDRRPTSASGSSGRSSRATAAAPGSGSTIARELSHALGGRIELDSEPRPRVALRAASCRRAEPAV